eukprot:TRINITY_DN121721_c0_g1_i1.p1 TRINITY_DN121721_c0_g1~~TRINITY_DN121721_c0_g1_i1.p1  ORF type:complete len:659 (+),score=60.64 TRINITY_DN121721_c0_g1_i1:197-1978(+)
MAGLSAAHALRHSVEKLVLLEPRQKLGGRVQTVVLPAGDPTGRDAVVDVGASWIHFELGNPVRQLADLFNCTTYRSRNMDVGIWLGGQRISDSAIQQTYERMAELQTELADAKEELWETAQDESLEAVLDRMNALPFEPFERQLMNTLFFRDVVQDYTAPVSQLSARWFGEDDDPGAGGDVRVPDGMQCIINGLGTDIDARLGWTATSVDSRGGDGFVKVTAISHGGGADDARGTNTEATTREFLAKLVIVAVPLGVLQQSLRDRSAGASSTEPNTSESLLQFLPPLPALKAAAFQGIGVGNAIRVALRFPEVFWPEIEFLVHYRANSFEEERYGDSDVVEFTSLSSSHGFAILVGEVDSKHAAELQDSADEVVVDHLVGHLCEMFPNCSRPISHHVLRFNQPNFRGGISYWRVGSRGARENMLAEQPVEHRRLLFAGEYASTHFGTLDAAFLAGLSAAQRTACLLGLQPLEFEQLKSLQTALQPDCVGRLISSISSGSAAQLTEKRKAWEDRWSGWYREPGLSTLLEPRTEESCQASDGGGGGQCRGPRDNSEAHVRCSLLLWDLLEECSTWPELRKHKQPQSRGCLVQGID